MDINDIIRDPNPVIIKIVEKELETLLAQKLHNVDNYLGLLDKIQDYDCFHVITEDDTLIAFGGLYSKRWNNVGRALQRAYKNPLYRRKGLSYNSSTDNFQHLWSEILAPLQISVAKKIGLDAIIVTTEFPRRWKSLNRFTQEFFKLPEHSDLYGMFEMLPDMYFVCNKYNVDEKYTGVHLTKTCWQNVSLCTLNNEYVFDFESMTHNEWKDHFEK